ncbi:MAG TPA: hypothetical protein IAC62_16305 [Candidatus Pelethocola excrementipullorum]|nr:hypothetical protein [Candidatus Pelethocola excrementipullorum]
MKRKNKIAFGIISIVLAMTSAGIGFGLLGDIGDTYSFTVKFVLRFFFIATAVFTVLAVINLLKKDK